MKQYNIITVNYGGVITRTHIVDKSVTDFIIESIESKEKPYILNVQPISEKEYDKLIQKVGDVY